MLETHRAVTVYSDTVPAAAAAVDVLNVNNAFAYAPPNTQLRSDTDELQRDWATGIGLINTPRTQSAFGRLKGVTQTTTDCSFVINNPYASVVVSSLTSDPIASSSKVMIVASARAQNTGMGYDLLETRVVVTGRAPIMCEPVTGTVSFRTSRSSLTLYPIRVGGTRGPGVSVPVVSGSAVVELKPEYRTIFYEVE